jgi:hypothetical protein
MPMTKFVGKPYAGKPHVRIDEGAGKGFYPSRSTLPVKKDLTAESRKGRAENRREIT